MRRGSLAAAVAALFLSAAPVAAQSTGAYQVVQGDELFVSYIGSADPVTVRVDVDGEIRLNDVGGIRIAGRTLDEVESVIEAAIAEVGLFVDPSASVRISDYAPVSITGDVSTPGRYSYVPGMTVEAALGLAGGEQRTGISQFDLERARVQSDGEVRGLNLDIAQTVARIARLEAIIADAEEIAPSLELVAQIPRPGAVEMDRLLSAEAAIYENDLGRRADLLAFWAAEIDTIEQQLTFFEERIAQQERIVENAAGDLERTRELEERGLQTATRINAAEQRDADARSRMIELQSALVQATQSISEAERARAQFLRNRQEEALTGLRVAQVELDDALLRYRTAIERRLLLYGGTAGLLTDADFVTLDFMILSPRTDRPGAMIIRPETPLLPGDTLVVRVETGDSRDG